MWSDLSLRQRAQLIQMGVRAGIGDAVQIRKLYDQQSLSNQYPDGGGFKDKSGNYVHPGNFVYQQLYPLYRDFIIPQGGEVDLSDAEKKRLFMTYVEDADMVIRSLYDPKSFTPHQYASLLASAVQGSFAKKNTVNKGSKFWQSYNAGKPNYDYLRLPTGLANDLIYEWAYKGIPGDMHNYQDPTGENIFGQSMSYHIPEIEVVAPKIRKFKPEPEIDWEYNEEVRGVPPIAPRPKEETKEEPIAKKIKKTYIPGFDPQALFVNFGDYDNYRYKTFKYSLDPDKVIPQNKAQELQNVETIGFLQRMQDIQNPEEDEFYVNPMLKTAAYGGNLFSTGSSLTDPPGGWKSLYPGINWNTDLNSIEKDDQYSINDIGEVQYPKFKDWSNGHDWNEVAPAYMQDNINDTATYGDIYDRMSQAYQQHNVDARMADRKNHPEKYTGDLHNYNNRLRHEVNLTSLGEFGDYVNGIGRSVRDIIPYGFNRGVEYLIGKPLNFVLNSFAESPVTNNAGMYSYSPGMQYLSDSGASKKAVADVSNNVLSWTTPSGIAGHIFPGFIEGVRDSEWGNAAINALDLYATPKMYSGKTYRGIANGVDYVRGKMGNSAAATRYIGRNMLYDPMEGTMLGITIEPTVRTKVGDVEINDPNLMYHLDMGDNIGTFNEQGAYIKNGQLIPGISNVPNQENYSWWNLGKPYATSINGNRFTRLVTTHKSDPNLLHVRSQNYPIGQWNGKKGLVTNSEYVSNNPIDVSNSIYHWDPTYGYRRVQNTPRQPRLVPEGTYPLYTGPRFSMGEVVNLDGTINPWNARRIQHTVADYFGKDFFSDRQAFRMEERLENPKWHIKDPTTYDHTKYVTESAQQLPTSPGYTKQEQIAAALGHDFGKMVAGNGHAVIGADLIQQVFPDVSKNVTQAIAEHMNSNPSTTLGQATKAADIINGGSLEKLQEYNPELYKIITDLMNKGISNAEKLGIPKGERGMLTADQTAAIEDLFNYINSGQYRQNFLVTPDGDVTWGQKGTGTPFMKYFIDNGGTYREPFARMGYSSDYGNGVVSYNPNKNMAGYSSRSFPKNFEGNQYGEAAMHLDGNNGQQMILTAPRTDFFEGVIDEGAKDFGESLPNTIDKNIMKDFWISSRNVQRPGTYLSGDNGRLPLGSSLIEGFRKRQLYKTPLEERSLADQFTRRTGLSPDSYSSIIRQGNRNGSLRWGEGFEKWNNSAVDNAYVYDAWKRMKKGEIPVSEYEKIFNDWSLSMGGRPLQIVEINGRTHVIHPHPYIYKKKFGGNLYQYNSNYIGDPNYTTEKIFI